MNPLGGLGQERAGRASPEMGRMTAFGLETVERWFIAAAAPDPSSDERAAPSHTMMDRGSA